MMRRSRAVLACSLAGLTTLLAACVQGPAMVETTPGGGIGVTAGRRFGWATKRIVDKHPPATLVAADGTVCRVAPDRFKDTKPDALVYCDWQPGAPPADSTKGDRTKGDSTKGPPPGGPR